MHKKNIKGRKLKFEKKKIEFAFNFSLCMEKVKNIYKKNKIMKKNIVDDSKMYFDCMKEVRSEIYLILVSMNNIEVIIDEFDIIEENKDISLTLMSDLKDIDCFLIDMSMRLSKIILEFCECRNLD